MNNKITLAFSSIRKEIVFSLLSIAYTVKEPCKIVIYDQANESLLKDTHTNIIVDFLRGRGFRVECVVEKKKSIGESRAQMIKECTTPYLIMIDDDLLLGENAIAKIQECLETKEDAVWAVSTNYEIQNDRIDKENLKKFGIQKFEKIKIFPNDMLNSFKCCYRYTEEEYPVELETAVTMAIGIKVSEVKEEVLEILEKFPFGMPREDVLLTKAHKGYLVDAETYHMGVSGSMVLSKIDDKIWNSNEKDTLDLIHLLVK